MKKKSAYQKAGVNLEAGISITKKIGKLAKSTFTPNVLSEIGSFGGLYKVPSAYKNPVFVASTDGVGTKVMLAAQTGRFAGVGKDIVNHCVDDILVQGAEPLFFLDYVAFPSFSKELIADVISGMSQACKKNHCALLGGETAEMPGVYKKDHFDLVGTIVGVVEKNKIIDGSKIAKDDVILGLPSSGLHTNGYSLARKVLNKRIQSNDKVYKNKTILDLLLEPHKSYFPIVKKIWNKVNIHGMAHITGGGFDYNVGRVVPNGLKAIIDVSQWTVPFIFKLIQQEGKVELSEMYDVFNMGIGLVLFLNKKDADKAMKILDANKEKYFVLGNVEKSNSSQKVVLRNL